ncbi:E3 ubiquitin-protein ligase MIB1-like [Ruditapes philippinarum]|uniref:E3 ubiquitin-protein ligase MIB1-like n=1 Tax=Ruditapes philippinarum TaxID=129788 RepID=UPI00295B8EA9|nr:E3 ubiquitin-protein ligase MIB1-like [Ruditapes philippinarum]
MAFVEDKDGLANAYVRVKWEIGHDVKEYRFGVGGFVDVVASRVSKGGKVYVDHMPVIGIIKVKPGDKVSVNMSLKEFQDAQKNGNIPGGWKDEMKQCVNELGTVVELLFGGDMARVQYPDGNFHIISKAALYRVNMPKEILIFIENSMMCK